MHGISHLTFIVRDLERMAVFLCAGLGAREVYDSAGADHSLSREKFFVLGGVWIAAMEGEPPAQRSYQHVAFRVDAADLPRYAAALEAIGADVRPPRPRIDGEGESLYVHDFDNHLFELHTGTLEQRLARYGVTDARRLLRAVPNETCELMLEFAGGEYRLLDTARLRNEHGWRQLAYPQQMKRFVVTPAAIEWPGIGRVDADALHAMSTPVAGARLQHHLLRLSYCNRAPTAEDAHHHVYGVYLAPFAEQVFSIGESIGGGHGERGGGRAYSLVELLAWPGWRQHFERAGCGWAISLVEARRDEPQGLVDALVAEACRRNGSPEHGEGI